MAYTFETTDGGLYCESGDSKIQVTLPTPVVELAVDRIILYDTSLGQWKQTLRLVDFGTVDGVEPTDIEDAYALLYAVQEAINPSGGGGSGGGDASSANQVIGNDLLSTISTNGFISTINSSTTPLAGDAVFTGTSQEALQYGTISVAVFSDVASAVNGLSIQQSTNGTNWDVVDVYTIAAGVAKVISVGRNARYIRVVYTNGASIQTVFRLQTIFTKEAIKDSSVRPQDARANDNDMSENLAYQMVYDPILNVWNRQQDQDIVMTGAFGLTALNTNVIDATGSSNSTDVLAFRSVSFQITPTGTISAGALTFEGSNDNINFNSVFLHDESLSINPQSSVSLSTATPKYFSGVILYRYIRIRISTAISGGGSIQCFSRFGKMTYQPKTTTVSQSVGANFSATISGGISGGVNPGTTSTNLGKAEDAAHSTGDTGVFMLGVRQDTQVISTSATGDYSLMAMDEYGNNMVRSYATQRKTYSSSFSFTPAATATDSIEFIGSSSSIQITKIIIGGVATASAALSGSVIKRSSLATGGTSANQALVPHQSSDGASTATLKLYSANPTTGTSVGSVLSFRIPLGSATDPKNPLVFNFGATGKPLLLTAASQSFCLNFAGGAIPAGASVDFTIEYTEI